MVLCRISSQSRRSKVRWWPWPYWPHLWENWRGEHKVAFNACRRNKNFCRTWILADNGKEERRQCCELANSMQHVLWGCRIQRTSTSIQNHDIVNKTWNSKIHSLTVVHKSGKSLSFDCQTPSSTTNIAIYRPNAAQSPSYIWLQPYNKKV